MFTSYAFAGFLAAVFVLYYVIPRRFQWMLLLAASLLFYFYAGKSYLVFIFLTGITVYASGRWMAKFDAELERYIQEIRSGGIPKPSREEKKAYKKKINGKKKRVMLLCLFLNIGILAVLKYTNFFIDNINYFRELSGAQPFSFMNLILPMGISFYTFQAVGYLLDVYWNKCRPQKNIFRFLLFVSFFPQLVQGPISRYGDMSETLYGGHSFDWKQVRFGLERILWGYFKKLVIADRISAAVRMLMEDPDYYTGAFVVVGMLFYAVQLYADFTGGIDITIGIAQVFGIRLEENFVRPFFSKNIAEYWRRWHITMGTWFRDYVFYPFSISRPLKAVTSFCKKRFGMAVARRAAVYISTVVVWLATGIWHGAAWHFVAWGLANGVIILISEELEPCYKAFHTRFTKLGSGTAYRAFQVIRTFLLMCCIRLFDNYGSVRTSVRQFIHMFTEFDIRAVTGQELLDLGLGIRDYAVVGIGVILMFAVSMGGRTGCLREKISRRPYAIRYTVFLTLFFAVLLLGCYGANFDARQFIYNQF